MNESTQKEKMRWGRLPIESYDSIKEFQFNPSIKSLKERSNEKPFGRCPVRNWQARLSAVQLELFSAVCNRAIKMLDGSKSRHGINLPGDFVRDSAFPFKVREGLVARI